jgi:hypothetical protein
MHEGRVTGVVEHREATEELLMAYATGLRNDSTPGSRLEAVAA